MSAIAAHEGGTRWTGGLFPSASKCPVCCRCKDESSPSFCLPKRSDDHADRAGDYKFNPLVLAEIQTGADWFADDFVMTFETYYESSPHPPSQSLLQWQRRGVARRLDEFVRKTYYEQHDSQQQVCGRGPGGPKLSLC